MKKIILLMLVLCFVLTSNTTVIFALNEQSQVSNIGTNLIRNGNGEEGLNGYVVGNIDHNPNTGNVFGEMDGSLSIDNDGSFKVETNIFCRGLVNKNYIPISNTPKTIKVVAKSSPGTYFHIIGRYYDSNKKLIGIQDSGISNHRDYQPLVYTFKNIPDNVSYLRYGVRFGECKGRLNIKEMSLVEGNTPLEIYEPSIQNILNNGQLFKSTLIRSLGNIEKNLIRNGNGEEELNGYVVGDINHAPNTGEIYEEKDATLSIDDDGSFKVETNTPWRGLVNKNYIPISNTPKTIKVVAKSSPGSYFHIIGRYYDSNKNLIGVQDSGIVNFTEYQALIYTFRNIPNNVAYLRYGVRFADYTGVLNVKEMSLVEGGVPLKIYEPSFETVLNNDKLLESKIIESLENAGSNLIRNGNGEEGLYGYVCGDMKHDSNKGEVYGETEATLTIDEDESFKVVTSVPWRGLVNKNYIPISDTPKTIKAVVKNGEGISFRIIGRYYDSNKNLIGIEDSGDENFQDYQPIVYTFKNIPNNTAYLRYGIRISDYTGTINVKEMSLVEGDTPLETYESYSFVGDAIDLLLGRIKVLEEQNPNSIHYEYDDNGSLIERRSQ